MGEIKPSCQDSGEKRYDDLSVRGYSPGHAGVRIQARGQEVCRAFIMSTKQTRNYYVCTNFHFPEQCSLNK